MTEVVDSHPRPSGEAEATRRVLTPVSVIMPVLSEELYLEESVRRILDQEYDGEVEIILAVGPSNDRTEEIAHELAAADGRIKIVTNPPGTTPHGLNAAIAASTYPYIVRVDAHGFLPDDYLRDVVHLLDVTGAANVGGMMRVEGETDFGHAVAEAMSSKLGIGGSKFHVGGQPGSARTVYLGSFRRDVLERVGGFDEFFLRAQDWELNYRIRQLGETVWFTPELSVGYRPRRTFKALRRQFFGSGQWRRQIVARYPETTSFRYLAAPVATALVGLGALVGLVGLVVGSLDAAGVGVPGSPWLDLVLLAGLLAPAGYAFGVLGATFVMGRRRRLGWRVRILLPMVVATMHLSWGSGFLRSVRRS